MPETLRSTTLKIANEGHPGIVLMKRRVHIRFLWPGIDRNAEDMCRKCHSFEVVSQTSAPEPIKSLTYLKVHDNNLEPIYWDLFHRETIYLSW
jgi:hypothetical protein